MKLSEKLSELASRLVDAENQLHGLSHTKMARHEISHVEIELRKLANGIESSDREEVDHEIS